MMKNQPTVPPLQNENKKNWEFFDFRVSQRNWDFPIVCHGWCILVRKELAQGRIHNPLVMDAWKGAPKASARDCMSFVLVWLIWRAQTKRGRSDEMTDSGTMWFRHREGDARWTHGRGCSEKGGAWRCMDGRSVLIPARLAIARGGNPYPLVVELNYADNDGGKWWPTQTTVVDDGK